jgi:hypothetical protein
MLRACCERVVSMLRTRLRATSNIRSLSPLPPCCDYITNMLRPVLCATSNIKSSPLSPPRHKSQHHMLQHRNSTSATLKFNVCNTTCVCNIELDICKHRKIMFATSKKLLSNFETFAWDTCNMSRTLVRT